MVRRLKAAGYPLFLDLKLHDIPHTVEKAMKVLSGLGVDMVNVHAAGTRAMMEAAREGLGAGPKLLAVTMLTSTDEAHMQQELGISGSLKETVLSYASNARSAGLDGVVCSPLESGLIHGACGPDFLTVTPGIRFPENETTTPSMAASLGSDYIVVGRPITAASDPLAAWQRCRKEFLL